ncbi:Rad50_zinc hook motif-containing protein [Hexamita inflata]|uniref:Rad50 zinc hook motif-containing protein n=1 Tax=Hexamita inflata TaxID=28002 RepID=A0AA86V7U9_9EUKA|nr:Rad50 zinc hook motif-containing protein [Hexamita inflata]
MLPDLLLTCPFCSTPFNHQDFIIHLKKEHNFAITKLIQFHDPRYYLALLQHFGPDYLLQNAVPRESDNVLMLQHTDADLELRKMAFAYQRSVALQQLEYEMTARVSHVCFICKQNQKQVNYQQILEHYTENHRLRVGFRQSVVYIKKMLQQLEISYNELTCQYCKQVFTTQQTLKNHYRTHAHFRFAMKDTQFDCYYLDCYREFESSRQSENEDLSDDPSTNQDQEIDLEFMNIPKQYLDIFSQIPSTEPVGVENLPTCLFCSHASSDLLVHMQNEHHFTFSEQLWGDFYMRIRQINFIRDKVELKTCPFCFCYNENLAEHVQEHSQERIQAVEDESYFRSRIEGDQIFDFIGEEVEELDSVVE